jgi:hypothetical protein
MKCLQLSAAVLLWVFWLSQTAATAAARPDGALLSSRGSSSSRRKLRQLEWFCRGGGAAEVVTATGVTRRSRLAGGSSSIRTAKLPMTYDLSKVHRFKRKVPLERQEQLYEARRRVGDSSLSPSSLRAARAAAAANLQEAGSSSSSSSSKGDFVRPAGLVRPESVCPLDPPFNLTSYSR